MKTSEELDCAHSCLYWEVREEICNSYSFEKLSSDCHLAKLAFLEDPSPGETSHLVMVDERALEILNTIRHPLEFSAQLEQEVRARACRAPASVLATYREAPLQVSKQQQQQAVVLEPVGAGGWAGGGATGQVYTGQVYRQLQYPGGPGDQPGTTRWQLLQDGDHEDTGTVLRYYDYHR